MNRTRLRLLLERVERGELPPEQALEELESLPFKDLGFARVDHHRALRQGVPEVVFAPGKDSQHLVGIARELKRHGQTVLVTRISGEQWTSLSSALPEAEHNPVARTAVIWGPHQPTRAGRVAVVTAGTSDLPVAEEAVVTLSTCGVNTERLADVGVAGLHRLLSEVDELRRAQVLIVVAGMEGALASVVGGLIQAPIIAVPTSIGYGAAFEGLAALLGMLTSCAAGVCCVNIDNGFGAAMAAVRMLDAFAIKPVEG